MEEPVLFEQQWKRMQLANPLRISGHVTQIVGLVLEVKGLRLPVNSLCKVTGRFNPQGIEAEVVGFRQDRALLMLYGETTGIMPGDKVECISRRQEVAVSDQLLGRIVNGRGQLIDGGESLYDPEYYPLSNAAPDPLTRKRIREPLQTGIRCLDGLLTVGKGQRMGLFAGSGVGKSVTLGMIARNTNAEVNVICMIGERGREVREFLERDLGPEGMKRSVVVVATSDQPALVRVKAPFVACAIAEYFREQGKDVMLMMDSVTRIAFAQREIGLSVGEPPATKGYPPSVFALMPRLLERAGCSDKGSITGFYTVLVEADDINEPIADTVRGILDGHVWFSRDLAARAHYPAVDPLLSISRVAIDVVSDDHQKATKRMISMLATYRQAEDLINIGAYVKGSNQRIDQAVAKIDLINGFLQQGVGDRSDFAQTRERLLEIMDLKQAPSATSSPEQAKAARVNERARRI